MSSAFGSSSTCHTYNQFECLPAIRKAQGVMEEFSLGPNGAMLYCLEYLEKNVDWLMEKLEGLTQKYLIFDFPGQVCG